MQNPPTAVHVITKNHWGMIRHRRCLPIDVWMFMKLKSQNDNASARSADISFPKTRDSKIILEAILGDAAKVLIGQQERIIISPTDTHHGKAVALWLSCCKESELEINIDNFVVALSLWLRHQGVFHALAEEGLRDSNELGPAHRHISIGRNYDLQVHNQSLKGLDMLCSQRKQ